MRKIKRWCLGLVVIMVIVGIVGYLVVEAVGVNSEFISMSHAGVKHDLFEENEKIYIGKDFKWTGSELPTINKVEIIKNNGKKLHVIDHEIRINLFVDETQQAGTIFGEITSEEQKIINNLKRLKDYQLIDHNMTMVFEVQLINPRYQYDLESIVINYTVDGNEYEQEVPLKNFIFH